MKILPANLDAVFTTPLANLTILDVFLAFGAVCVGIYMVLFLSINTASFFRRG
jgi:hypothetical protein